MIMATKKEIQDCYLQEKAAREAAGFSMPGSRAVEDVAWLFDISIHEVCKAIAGAGL